MNALSQHDIILPSTVNINDGDVLKNEKLQRIKMKLIKQQQDIRIRKEISKKFRFHDSWRRTKFPCHSIPDRELEQRFQTDTFDNQKQFGKEIFDTFRDHNVTHVLAAAPTQSGKTGSMISLARYFNQSDSMRVDCNNIFVFTGHSSKEWTEQTKNRFPTSLKDNIFHRNNFKQFVENFADLTNALILFDESHIANKFGQTLYSLYRKLGFFDIPSLYRRNIKIIHFTATPNSILPYIHIWQNSLKVKHMNVPNNYVSAQHYLLNEQVVEALPLHDNHKNIYDILSFIDIDNPFYHIIRTPRGAKHNELIQDFKLTFSSFDFEYISEPSYFKFNANSDISSLFMRKPHKHTFVFIIDKLRCAKSIHIQHTQIFYDRFVLKPNLDSVIQGLLGRCTGFHEHTSHIRIFTFKRFILSQQSHEHQSHSEFNIFYPC